MYTLYSLLLTFGFVLLLPRFLWDAVRHGKYAEGFWERAGGVKRAEASGRPVIWLHCVSVGEAQAARPVARAILTEFPNHSLVVSTTTRTGQRVARAAFEGLAQKVFYFPFDWGWSVRRSLRRIKPSAVLVMETELWPRFLRESRRAGLPVALINGRISEKSFRRYRLIRSFIKRVLSDLDLIIMQSHADAERIHSLGAPRERVKVSGNTKFDADVPTNPSALTEELRARFHFGDGRPLIVAASTHAPEERVILDAFKRLRAAPEGRGVRILIAPRHPERFDEVATLLDQSGLTWSRRSLPARESDVGCDAVLLDSVGELQAVYPLAELVFVGGSIAPVGGHNVIEPALHAKCVVTGPHTSNFKSIVEQFLARGGLVQLPEQATTDEAADSLASAFIELLRDDARRMQTAEEGRAVVEENRGATARTVSALRPLLERTLIENRAPASAAERRLASRL